MLLLFQLMSQNVLHPFSQSSTRCEQAPGDKMKQERTERGWWREVCCSSRVGVASTLLLSSPLPSSALRAAHLFLLSLVRDKWFSPVSSAAHHLHPLGTKTTWCFPPMLVETSAMRTWNIIQRHCTKFPCDYKPWHVGEVFGPAASLMFLAQFWTELPTSAACHCEAPPLTSPLNTEVLIRLVSRKCISMIGTTSPEAAAQSPPCHVWCCLSYFILLLLLKVSEGQTLRGRLHMHRYF